MAEAAVNILVEQRYGKGWRAFPWYMDGSGGASPESYTTTNVQEAGVDEMDIVKTNGRNIYYLNHQELMCLKSWPAEESSILSRMSLDGYPQGLLLDGDILVVISSIWDYGEDDPRFQAGSRVDLYDVSDPGEPLLLREINLSSWVSGARLINSDLYLILSDWGNLPAEAWELIWRDDLGLPELPAEASDEERERAAAEAREILMPLVTAIVDGLEVEDFLPLYREGPAVPGTSGRELLLPCGDIYRSGDASSLDFLSVMHLDLGNPLGDLEGNAVIANGFTVYASTGNIYVGRSSWWWWRGFGDMDLTTDIHVFDISGESGVPVRYAASGEVPGWLQSQFSFSEYGGFLRVATTMDDWFWGFDETDMEEGKRGSVISVLKDGGTGELELVGQLSGIAPGEQIYASRMMGERGYLVTYEQVDPLFTIDLSDPVHPSIAGILKMPGYSAYLHPIDETYLLAVGMAGDDAGHLSGLAVNLFDVSNFSTPVLLHSYELEDDSQTWSFSEVLADHHAFTFDRNILSMPAYLYRDGSFFSGLLVLRLDLEEGFEELGWVDHGDLPQNPDGWYGNFARMRRSIYMEDHLYSLSDRGVKVGELEHPDVLEAEIPFFSPTPDGGNRTGSNQGILPFGGG